MLVLPEGDIEFANWEGTYRVDADTARVAIDAFNEQGVDVPIDYGHWTLEEEKGGEPKAVGWITALKYEKGKGLFADVKLSDDAQSKIKGEEVKYVSPVARFNKETKSLTGIHSLALTNKPATKKMPEILQYAASQGKALPADERIIVASFDYPGGEAASAAETLRQAAYTLDSCVALLRAKGIDIPPDQDPMETVGQAIEYLAGLIDEHNKSEADTMAATQKADEKKGDIILALTERLGLKADANPDEIILEVEKLRVKSDQSNEVAALTEKLNKLQSERDAEVLAATEKRIGEKISAACKEGRINPNSDKQMESIRAMYKLNEQAADNFIASIQPVLPSGRMTTPTAGTGNGRDTIIAASVKDFEDNELGLRNLRIDAHVNGALRESGHKPLTKDEITKIKSGGN